MKNSMKRIMVFENHNGMTFLGEGERPLGTVKQGKGNNGQDNGEGVVYKKMCLAPTSTVQS